MAREAGVHLRTGAGAIACNCGVRWSSRIITSTTSTYIVSCKGCLRTKAFRDAANNRPKTKAEIALISALNRLGSMEAFHVARAFSEPQDTELLLRIKYARNAVYNFGEP